MWAIPDHPDACALARTRSLWFGVIPTFSGDLAVDGNPKLDDTAIYVLRCVVRVRSARGQEECPPHLYGSDPTEPFRLAAFFDPQGTKNRQSHIKMPDLRALAANAGSGGGVSIETPPGSMLSPKGDGNMPKGTKAVGAAGENCSYAIELLMIVATFVFSLFLPIVTFVFQLWWMLLLKFCWPSNADAKAQLDAYFATNPLRPPPSRTGSVAEPTVGETALEFGAAVFDADSRADQTDLVAPQLTPGALQSPVNDPLC
jgi:hypothetical protein